MFILCIKVTQVIIYASEKIGYWGQRLDQGNLLLKIYFGALDSSKKFHNVFIVFEGHAGR